jgi:hypothetical protein
MKVNGRGPNLIHYPCSFLELPSKTMRNLSQGSRCLDRYLNPEFPQYKRRRVLTPSRELYACRSEISIFFTAYSRTILSRILGSSSNKTVSEIGGIVTSIRRHPALQMQT